MMISDLENYVVLWRLLLCQQVVNFKFSRQGRLLPSMRTKRVCCTFHFLTHPPSLTLKHAHTHTHSRARANMHLHAHHTHIQTHTHIGHEVRHCVLTHRGPGPLPSHTLHAPRIQSARSVFILLHLRVIFITQVNGETE